MALMLLMIGVCFLAATATYSGVEAVSRSYLRDLLDGRRKILPAGLLGSQQA
jgi:hypothetical protein